MFKIGTYAIYKENLYRLGFNSADSSLNLYSTNNSPDFISINNSEVKYAFQVRVWMKYKGCDMVLTNGVKKDYYNLNVRPSEDVNIVGAKEVDRGVYNVELHKSLIEKAWEERIPLYGFEFPAEIEKYKEISLEEL